MRENAKRTDELTRIAELVAKGRVKVHAETVLPLRDARQAQELSQSGHSRGRILLATNRESGIVM